jgi:hypothetical protein
VIYRHLQSPFSSALCVYLFQFPVHRGSRRARFRHNFYKRSCVILSLLDNTSTFDPGRRQSAAGAAGAGGAGGAGGRCQWEKGEKGP